MEEVTKMTTKKNKAPDASEGDWTDTAYKWGILAAQSLAQGALMSLGGYAVQRLTAPSAAVPSQASNEVVHLPRKVGNA